MNLGKKKCEALKAIRKQIADLNNMSIKKKKGNILKVMGVATGLSAITAFQEAVAQEQATNADSTTIKFEWEFRGTFFTTAGFPPETLTQWDEMAEFISKFPNDTFLVLGHTDNRGSFQYNLKLSTTMANLNRTLLIERGVDPYRILSIGCGPAEPKIPNAETESEHEQNRRITLEFYSPQRVEEIEKKTKTK